jgi:uncharacterized protein (TIGR02172 family)
MEEVRVEKGEKTTIFLSGNIDSGNAADVEQEINNQLGESLPPNLVVDAENLKYISSAGLRILLRLRKKAPAMSICNVSPDVYDILEMTGFTQMMDVGRAYRRISVEGCEVIGEGANGKVYRVDNDNVVKTYKNADALSEIQNEREVAKLALVLGIPTAISYDVVRVDDSYGSVFELLDTTSFAKILANEPERMDWCVEEYVKLLKLIHSTDVPEGKLPHIVKKGLLWVSRLRGRLPDEVCDKVEKLFKEAPDYGHMIHGDYHTKNVVLSGGEVLLIDMDTLSVGHPIFELGQMYNAFIGFFESDPDGIKDFQGFDYETSKTFWDKVLKAYLGTDDESYVKPIEDKIKLEAYVRIMDWAIRHRDESDEQVKKDIERWTEIITDLAGRIDSLDFQCVDDGGSDEPDYEELKIEATVDNLPKVMEFIDGELEKAGCGMKQQMQIDIAVEEIFVNIANYAYAPGTGEATIRVSVVGQPAMATITFIDSGVPYNPLAKDDPDVTLSAEERQVGGLGIFMVKNSMDDMIYEYKDKQNILTLKKQI